MTGYNKVRKVTKSRMVSLPDSFKVGDLVFVKIINENKIEVTKAKVVPIDE